MANPYLLSYDDIFEQVLTDYKNLDPSPDTGVGSQAYISAACLASAIWSLYKYQDYVSQQPFPDTCDTDSLNHWGSIYGVARLSGETDNAYANRMIGLIRIPPSGGTAQDYKVWAQGVSAQANVAESLDQSHLSVGNDAIPTVQSFQTDSELVPSVVNLSSTGTLPVPFQPATPYYVVQGGGNQITLSDTRGGAPIIITDTKSGIMTISQDASQPYYYASYVNILTPPTAGVSLGSVNVVFSSNDSNISGQPAETTLQTAIIAAINLYQPVIAVPASTYSVLPATTITQDIYISGILPTSVSLSDMKLAITNYMSDLDPGEVLYLTQIQSLCIQSGAVAVTVNTPTNNVTPLSNQAIRPGNVVLSF